MAPSERGLSKIYLIFDWGRECVDTVSPSVIFALQMQKCQLPPRGSLRRSRAIAIRKKLNPSNSKLCTIPGSWFCKPCRNFDPVSGCGSGTAVPETLRNPRWQVTYKACR